MLTRSGLGAARAAPASRHHPVDSHRGALDSTANASGSVGVEDARPFSEHGNCLPQGNEVAASGSTRASRLTAFSLGNGMQRDFSGLLKFSTQSNILGFEAHHAPNSFEVHALRSQLGDAPQDGDIGIAVAAIAALRPSRLDEPATFVDPQRLRMHPREFSRDRNDIHR